jgi:very-short-patch-repair endonuclease
LIIEVDGGIHSVQELEDEERQGNLESADLHLLRFTNDDVLKNLDRVLETICAEVKRLGTSRK